MKSILLLLTLMIGLVAMSPGPVKASVVKHEFVVTHQQMAPAAMMQEEGGVVAEPAKAEIQTTTSDFIKNNWIALLMGLLGFIELIVRLTPTEKDNSIFNWITALINALLPNLKKGGGTFKVSSE